MEGAALLKKGDAIAVDDLPHRPGFPWISAAEAKPPHLWAQSPKMQSREMWETKKSGVSDHQAQLLQVARLWDLLATHSITVVDAIFYRKPQFEWFWSILRMGGSFCFPGSTKGNLATSFSLPLGKKGQMLQGGKIEGYHIFFVVDGE